ncbi:hypothetical protein CIB48_g4609 [Xylaria polymorpha]|nr:hypothetical protein CIB48_g4609 [Xylaria polymorpha]
MVAIANSGQTRALIGSTTDKHGCKPGPRRRLASTSQGAEMGMANPSIARLGLNDAHEFQAIGPDTLVKLRLQRARQYHRFPTAAGMALELGKADGTADPETTRVFRRRGHSRIQRTQASKRNQATQRQMKARTPSQLKRTDKDQGWTAVPTDGPKANQGHQGRQDCQDCQPWNPLANEGEYTAILPVPTLDPSGD